MAGQMLLTSSSDVVLLSEGLNNVIWEHSWGGAKAHSKIIILLLVTDHKNSSFPPDPRTELQESI